MITDSLLDEKRVHENIPALKFKSFKTDRQLFSLTTVASVPNSDLFLEPVC
jgi:hypothetical protein